ncbi:relaxase domain-containing protein [Cerasicoccus maritimus]|uniref:relaxase domain-containing protein n=1 Tax=Cerasicoccus maritimus TaxID=490089 RepID=UPI0028527B36|nr:relaxase domain-containing protein [Cerasicoccus maritimus]
MKGAPARANVRGWPDPHLHMHCFAFSATYDETEQQWKALDIEPLKRNAPYWQAVYHQRLGAVAEGSGSQG